MVGTVFENIDYLMVNLVGNDNLGTGREVTKTGGNDGNRR